MDNSDDSPGADPAPPDDPGPDPEIEALLDFTPVVRRNKRSDGWSPDHQRGYISGLALTGDMAAAAAAVGRTVSGAYTVRNSAGGEEFADAWDRALALYQRRNAAPPAAPRSPRLGRPGHPFRTRDMPRRPAPPPAVEIDEAEEEELLEAILKKYWHKLEAERVSRLAGRIVEADFYVRQLTSIEIILDLGGKAQPLLETLKRRDVPALQVVATPATVLLEKYRRFYWQELGEVDRPPPAPLGKHDAAVSFGVPTYYNAERDGDHDEWCRRREQACALAAEAQAAWEEKARADAELWRRRVEDGGGSSPGFPGEGDHPPDGGGASPGADGAKAGP